MTDFESRDASGGRGAAVELRGVTRFFPQTGTGKPFAAVDHVDLSIRPGELVSLLGPSGCGKTTTLRMICGFEYPTEGTISIGGRDMERIPPERRGISMVFQNYALFPHMTVRENIAYGLRAAKRPGAEIAERTARAVARMHLDGMEERFPHQLSGGQQQRVALARALVLRPSVLLFDEPLSNLDAKLRETMRGELRTLQKELGITALYVTHDQAEAMAISDRIAIMKDGVLVQVGTPEEIYEEPADRFVADFVGRMNFIEGVLEKQDAEGALVRVGEAAVRVTRPGAMDGVRVGGDCCLAVRPEAVLLSADGEGFPGTVTRAVYYGSRMDYEVRLATGSILAEVPRLWMEGPFSVGDTVRVQPAAGCVRVLK